MGKTPTYAPPCRESQQAIQSVAQCLRRASYTACSGPAGIGSDPDATEGEGEERAHGAGTHTAAASDDEDGESDAARKFTAGETAAAAAPAPGMPYKDVPMACAPSDANL